MGHHIPPGNVYNSPSVGRSRQIHEAFDQLDDRNPWVDTVRLLAGFSSAGAALHAESLLDWASYTGKRLVIHDRRTTRICMTRSVIRRTV